MRLLAEEVALEQPFGRGPCPDRIVGGEPSLRHDRQGVLEAVGQAFTFGGEAIVTEALEQVAVVEVDGGLGSAGVVGEAGLERGDIEVDPRLDPDPDRVGVDIEQAVRTDPGLREPLADQPQGLAKRSGRPAACIGPEVGGDRLAAARSAGQDEQREERLGMAARETDVPAGRRPGVETPK